MKNSRCHSLWEEALYAKWKDEHGDVASTYSMASTTPEWWVRNYVETRLLPAFLLRESSAMKGRNIGALRQWLNERTETRLHLGRTAFQERSAEEDRRACSAGEG